MFKAKLAAAIFGVSFTALFTLGAIRNLEAQQNNPGVQQSGAVIAGHVTTWGPGVGQIQDGGAAPSSVLSVFTRTGNVVATLGDYSFSLISGTLSNSQLDTVNSNTGAFGGPNSVPSFTVNAQGRITAASANVPAIPFTELTGSLACGQTPAYTGDATTSAGSCATSVVKVNGIAFAATAAVDTVPVTTAANTTSTYTALPNCTTGALQYTTATHLISCAAAGSGTVTSVGGAGLAVASPAPIIGAGTLTVTQAVKSDQQAGTSNAVAVTPLIQQQHDSAAKAWASWTGSTGVIQASYNVASVTRVSAGIYNVNFTTSFANTNYMCTTDEEIGTGPGSSLGLIHGVTNGSRAVGSVQVQYLNVAVSTNADPASGFVVCFGRQ